VLQRYINEKLGAQGRQRDDSTRLAEEERLEEPHYGEERQGVIKKKGDAGQVELVHGCHFEHHRYPSHANGCGDVRGRQHPMLRI
jgi:hypothetical protein